MKKLTQKLVASMMICGACASVSAAEDELPDWILADLTAQTAAENSEAINKLQTKVKKINHKVKRLEQTSTQTQNDIISLDQKVADLEFTVVPQSAYGGFTMPFAPLGGARNVIVLSRQMNDGRTQYRVRVRYENDSETMVINGVEKQFAYIAVYGTVFVDADGNIVSVTRYRDGMDSPAYEQYSANNIRYNPTNLSVISTSNGADFVDTFYGLGAVLNMVRKKTTYDGFGGSTIETSSIPRVRSLSSGYSVNGMDFGSVPVRAETRTYLSNGTTEIRGQIRVKGVGTVQRTFASDGEAAIEAIYYNVDGASDGNLDGTPFAPGAVLDGFFF